VPFCLPVVCHRSSKWSDSVALKKGPWRFCPRHSDRCRALMFTCQNSLLWQRCEHCNNVLPSCWPPLNLINWTAESSCDMYVNWNKPQVSCPHFMSSLLLWTMLEYKLVDANGVFQVEPTTWSAVATWIKYNNRHIMTII